MTAGHPVPTKAFTLPWDGTAASLRGSGMFWECLVADPTRLIDPATHHVIATVQVGEGRVQHRTFMVPATQTDQTFTTWLALLTATAQPPLNGTELNNRMRELTPA